MTQYTAQDYKKGQPRWCPGCGDHFFLSSLHKAMAEIGVPPYETVDISLDVEALEQVKSLGYAQAPVVMAGEDHWSGFRPDKIKALAIAAEVLAV